MGLGRGDMDVGKGAFSSEDMGVLFLALKNSQPGSPGYNDKHRTRLPVAGSRGALGLWGKDEVH